VLLFNNSSDGSGAMVWGAAQRGRTGCGLRCKRETPGASLVRNLNAASMTRAPFWGSVVSGPSAECEGMI
jgi:hypothetical protein